MPRLEFDADSSYADFYTWIGDCYHRTIYWIWYAAHLYSEAATSIRKEMDEKFALQTKLIMEAVVNVTVVKRPVVRKVSNVLVRMYGLDMLKEVKWIGAIWLESDPLYREVQKCMADIFGQVEYENHKFARSVGGMYFPDEEKMKTSLRERQRQLSCQQKPPPPPPPSEAGESEDDGDGDSPMSDAHGDAPEPDGPGEDQDGDSPMSDAHGDSANPEEDQDGDTSMLDAEPADDNPGNLDEDSPSVPVGDGDGDEGGADGDVAGADGDVDMPDAAVVDVDTHMLDMTGDDDPAHLRDDDGDVAMSPEQPFTSPLSAEEPPAAPGPLIRQSSVSPEAPEPEGGPPEGAPEPAPEPVAEPARRQRRSFSMDKEASEVLTGPPSTS